MRCECAGTFSLNRNRFVMCVCVWAQPFYVTGEFFPPFNIIKINYFSNVVGTLRGMQTCIFLHTKAGENHEIKGKSGIRWFFFVLMGIVWSRRKKGEDCNVNGTKKSEWKTFWLSEVQNEIPLWSICVIWTVSGDARTSLTLINNVWKTKTDFSFETSLFFFLSSAPPPSPVFPNKSHESCVVYPLAHCRTHFCTLRGQDLSFSKMGLTIKKHWTS